MKSKKIILFAIATLLCTSAIAADRLITVTGKGEMQLRPDISRITVEVRSVHDTYSDAYSVADVNLRELGKVMTDCGLDQSLPKTSYFNIVRKTQSQYDQYHNYIGEKMIGYELQQNIRIDLGMDNALLARVIRSIGQQMKDVETSVAFTVRDARPQQAELLQSAVDDARAKAEKMAAAAGCRLGKVQTISCDEQPAPFFAQARKMAAANDMMMCTEESLDITPEDVKATARVTVIWQLR